jgi:hypothetical protein
MTGAIFCTLSEAGGFAALVNWLRREALKRAQIFSQLVARVKLGPFPDQFKLEFFRSL